MPLRHSEIAGLGLIGISRGPKRATSDSNQQIDALTPLGEVLSKLNSGLVNGAKTLMHVPHCMELRWSWAEFSVGFVEWWIQERLAKLVGLSGDASEERVEALQQVLREFECRFASLICEYEAACGMLLTEPDISVPSAVRLIEGVPLPEWWPVACPEAATAISHLMLAAVKEAYGAALDSSEFTFERVEGYGGRVFQMGKAWRGLLLPLMEQGVVSANADIAVGQLAKVQHKVEAAFCHGRTSFVNCKQHVIDRNADRMHTIVKVSDVLLSHLVIMNTSETMASQAEDPEL